jgi:PAS domain S-box-containing protein
MKRTSFEEQAVGVRERLALLMERAGALPSPHPLLQEVLEELSTSLEELQVTGEELRIQNDELLASRQTIETDRQRYRELFDFAPDGYLVTDPSGIIQEANRATSALFSIPKDFLVGRSLVLFVAEEDHKAFRTQLVRMGRVERLQDWEVKLRSRENSAFPAVISVTAIRDEDNKLTGLRWLIRDITKRKEMEKELAYLASYPQVNPNPIVEVDSTGTIHYLNPSAKRLIPDLEKTGVQHAWLEGLKQLAETLERERKSSIVREVKIGDFWYEQVWCRVPDMDSIHIYSHDITERKGMEESLRESERGINRAQEIAHLGSWELDLVHNRLTWSDEVYRMFGLQPQEFGATYEAFLEGVHPDDRVAVDTAYSGSLRENRDTYEIEHRVVRKDTNDIRVVHEKCEHFRDTTGKIIRSIGMVHDITERKQMEEELRKSRDELEIKVQERTAALVRANELLETMFSSIDIMVAYMDGDFNFIRVNRAYAEADERDPDFYAGKNHFVLFPNEENEAIFKKVLETGEPYFTYAKPFSYAEHPERGVTYWDWSLQPVKEPDGTVAGVVLSLVNVTDRLRAEGALRTNEALLRTVFETLPVGIWIADKQGAIIHGNPAGQRIWAGARYVGIEQFREYKGWWAETGRRIEPDEWGVARAVRKGETSIDEEIEIECFDGSHKIILNSAVPIRNEIQEIVGAFVVNQDITDRKEIQKRIEATNAVLDLFAKKSTRKEYLDGVVDLLQRWSGCRCVGVRVLNEKDYIPYESFVGFSQEFWESENWLSIKHDQCVCVRVGKGTPEPQDLPVTTPGGSFRCENTERFIGQLTEEEKARFRGVCGDNGFLSVAVIPMRYREKVLGAIHLADENEGCVSFKAIEFIESMSPLIGEAVNRFNLEEQLRKSESRLKHLSSQLLSVQENERKRISREIHDSLGQSLTAVKFRVENILQQMRKTRSKTMTKSLEDLMPVIQTSIEESRRIQMDLRPSILDDLGILATISWFCREFQATYSTISIHKEIALKEEDVPDRLKTVIYRVMQEAMNNIAKHSRADFVRLSLRKADSAIQLSVKDNGQGLDLEKKTTAGGHESGLGLTSMRERSELSGGSFSIESQAGEGTVIRASWPLQ